MKRYIPNTITCLNLFCGCLSIVCSLFGSSLETAAYLIFAAAVFDFFDGFAARWLKAYSEMGKELDSLADLVSFGVAPASIMFNLLFYSVANFTVAANSYLLVMLVASSAYIIAVFSALRLAKFNIDARQSDSFIGLPTPANAMFICSLVFISSGDNYLLYNFVHNIYFLLAVTAVSSYLLVVELPLFSLKFKSFKWKSNEIRYIFIAISGLILLALQWAGLALVILTYIILSIITNTVSNKKKR